MYLLLLSNWRKNVKLVFHFQYNMEIYNDKRKVSLKTGKYLLKNGLPKDLEIYWFYKKSGEMLNI